MHFGNLFVFSRWRRNALARPTVVAAESSETASETLSGL
jgi:hypothetical protein